MFNKKCALEYTLDILEGKWTILRADFRGDEDMGAFAGCKPERIG